MNSRTLKLHSNSKTFLWSRLKTLVLPTKYHVLQILRKSKFFQILKYPVILYVQSMFVSLTDFLTFTFMEIFVNEPFEYLARYVIINIVIATLIINVIILVFFFLDFYMFYFNRECCMLKAKLLYISAPPPLPHIIRV